MTNQVERLLEEQRSEGEFQNTGDFSLNVSKAREKVTRFGLDTAETGLLKVIQLAVRARSSLIKIRQTKEHLTITIVDGDRERFDLNHLSEELQVACWACLHAGFKWVKVSHSDISWHFDDQGLRQEPSFHTNSYKKHVFFEFQRLSPQGFWERLKSYLRGRAHDSSHLAKVLKYSNVRIEMDHRLLNQPTYEHKSSDIFFELFLTSTAHAYSETLSSLKSEGYLGSKHTCREEDLVVSSSGHWSTFYRNYKSAKTSRFGMVDRPGSEASTPQNLAHLWVPIRNLGDSAQSRLIFVKHGVIVGEIPFFLSGVVSAGGLDMDLSGLRLVKNEKLGTLLAYLCENVRRVEKRALSLVRPDRFSWTLQSYGAGKEKWISANEMGVVSSL